jgi:DNA 3'-phosphatase
VIYPINHKKFYPKKYTLTDWEPHPKAKAVLKNAVTNGFTIYFVTNQLKYNSIIENRFREMLRYFEIEALVLIADQRNVYRKPSAKLIQDPNIPGGIPTIDRILSFHCGDAAGRPNDFSDDDFWFANFAKINFYTPEEVFVDSFDFKPKIRKHFLKIPHVDEDLINILKLYYETSDGIMLIGLPGTGKSSIRRWMVDNLNNKNKPIYVYNNDENLHFPEKFDSKGFYIFDNTNLNKIQREKFSKNLNLKTIYIDLSAKEAIRGIKYRNIFQNGAHIPDVVINTMNAHKEIPDKIDLHLKKRPVLDEDFPWYLTF